jgi:hypothetical protein
MHDIICGTIQNDKRMNPCYGCNIFRLPSVTRDAIQDKHIVFREPNTVQIQGDDLFSEGEMFILEQEAVLKNAVNEIELLLHIGNGPVHAGNSISQFRPEIEVMTPASEQALLRNDVTERALADSGRAEEED